MSVTRVGFEPNLAGLKDQQPHQKLNEPYWLCRCAPLAQLFSKCFLQATHSVDWEVLEPSSPALQASAIPSQLPVHLHVKRWKKARKNPVSLWGNTGFANVCFVSTAECYLRCGCKGSAFAFCNTIQPSYPLNRSVLSRIEVMISYPVIDCFSDSSSRLVAYTGR